MIRRPGRADAQDFHDAWESGVHGTGQVAELGRTVGAFKQLQLRAVRNLAKKMPEDAR